MIDAFRVQAIKTRIYLLVFHLDNNKKEIYKHYYKSSGVYEVTTVIQNPEKKHSESLYILVCYLPGDSRKFVL